MPAGQPTIITRAIRLKDFATDYCGGLEKIATRLITERCQKRIGKLQHLLFAESRHAVLLLFQGLDASGKDGAIRKVLRYVNPAGVEIANFKVPSEKERAHDFLWRVHQAVPGLGAIGVFNRSHYEAVLVERILGIVPARECRRRFVQIADFERMLAENGIVLLKFFLHVGYAEQAKRFRERLENPRKRWKFSSADLETREHWKEYIVAYEEAINGTSRPGARWHVVPADHNWYRDYVVAQAVVRAMEELRLKWPKPKEDLSKVQIK